MENHLIIARGEVPHEVSVETCRKRLLVTAG